MSFCRNLPQHASLASYLLSLAETVSVSSKAFNVASLTQLLVDWASDRVKERSWEVQLKTLEEKAKAKTLELFLPGFVECEGAQVSLKLGEGNTQQQKHSFAEGDLFTLEPILKGGALLNNRAAQALYEAMQKTYREPVAVGSLTHLNPEIRATLAPGQMAGSVSKMLQGLEVHQVKWLLRPIPPLATVELCFKALSHKEQTDRNELLEALHSSFAQNTLHPLLAISAPAGKASTAINLNAQQEKAFLAALRRRMSLVSGPPGTGKTRFIAALTQEIVAQQHGAPVLLLAETNFAADNMLFAVQKLKAP